MSAQRAMRGSTQRDAGRAQRGRPKRFAGRPARLADGAEFSSDDELGVPLLTGAAVSVPPPTATVRRERLQSEVFPSTDAGDAHAGPSEEKAAQHEGAAGERALRRSGRHRTPSRKLADAVADAAGRQHGALIAPKLMGSRKAPVKADRRRAGASQHSYIPPSPREYPSNPCCQYITCLQIAAVRTWTQACMAKGLVSLQPNS